MVNPDESTVDQLQAVMVDSGPSISLGESPQVPDRMPTSYDPESTQGFTPALDPIAGRTGTAALSLPWRGVAGVCRRC